MWFWLSLGSAAFGAIDIALNKKVLHKVSPATLNWSLYVLSLPVLLILALREGIPAINSMFWISVFGSAITFALGKNIIYAALKNGLISKIIPLTSFSNIFNYVLALLFLGENIRFLPVLGLFLIVIGSYILNVDQAKEDIFKPFKILFASKSALIFMGALILTSATAIFDKEGILNTSPQGPLFVLLVEDILLSILFTFYLFYKEKTTWVNQLKGSFGLLFVNSYVLLIIAYLVFQAYSINGPVALVLGIKRLQIFFALVLGYLFFKDKPAKHAWIATAIMILGTILIKVG